MDWWIDGWKKVVKEGSVDTSSFKRHIISTPVVHCFCFVLWFCKTLTESILSININGPYLRDNTDAELY